MSVSPVNRNARTCGRLLAEARLGAGDSRFLSDLPTWLAEPLRGCTSGVIREAAVVLGELLTNAFRHAVPPYRVWLSEPSQGHRIRLGMDDGTEPPAAPWTPGKGLFVVRGLCPEWGVEPTDVGKTVWADLQVLIGPAD